jgi:predicted alpha/beta hydrolase family esterase
MATRKALCLVSGLFEEVNTPTDKLDFAGNSTTDLAEGTRLYYTDARARGAISVSTSGTGYGALSYSSATGVITFSVVTDANIRGALSVAVGSGLTYNSSTGVFGTSAIPNSQLANSSVTIGSTSVSLGGTATTVAGLTSLSSTTLIAGGAAGAANTIQLDSTGIVFEGSGVDAFETTLTVTNPTADRTITFPDAAGTVALLTSLSAANTGTGYGSLSYNSATGAFSYAVVTNANIRGALSASTTGTGYGSLTYNSTTGNYDFAVVTDANIRGALSVAVGSGLTYNSTTGQFGTSAIPNSQLANSSITVGSTAIALGSSSTTLTGLTSVTSTGITTNDSGFRIRNTTDITKQIAFSASSITAATTRTLTVQDLDGTIALSGNKLSFFAATTSAELAGVISNETGTGLLVFATSPSLTTPSLGVASATSINKVAITAPATSATLTIADGKTLTVSNTLTFSGTDASSVAFGAGGTVAYLGANNAFTGANTFTNATGQVFRRAATQDGIVITGRAGGSGSFSASITPATLTANRTVTLPDETGTVATQDFATAIAIALG